MEQKSISLLEKQENQIREIFEKASHEKRSLTKIEEADIYKEYAQIYEGYVKLAEQGDLEALKRAFFIQWFGYIEPQYLSGINYDQLPKSCIAKVLTKIESRIKNQEIDPEFEALLSWGYTVVDYYFDSFNEIPNLKSFFSRVDKNEDTFARLDLGKMKDRGILGQYYRSISRPKRPK
jgi:hypothetical protein